MSRSFRERGFGIFHHFGLYSLLGEGEWYKDVYHADSAAYEGLIRQFRRGSPLGETLGEGGKRSRSPLHHL
jgi:hypothetical protein